MLQVNNSLVDTVSGATLLDVIAKTSVTNCNATNTISPTFVTSTGDYNVSQDGTGPGANSLTNAMTGWFDVDYKLTSTAQPVLTGVGINGTNIGAWAYAVGGGSPDVTELAIDLSYLGSSATVFSPLLAKDKLLQLTSIESTSTLYNPELLKDKLIELAYVVPGSTVYDPELLKDKLIDLVYIEATDTLFAPLVTKDDVGLFVVPSFINPVAVVRSPSIVKDKLIALSSVLSTTIVHNPAVVKDKLIELNSILSTASVHGIEILAPTELTLDYIDSTLTITPPEVIGGYRPVPDVKLYPAEGFGLHIRSAEELNEVVKALIKRIEILEGH